VLDAHQTVAAFAVPADGQGGERRTLGRPVSIDARKQPPDRLARRTDRRGGEHVARPGGPTAVGDLVGDRVAQPCRWRQIVRVQTPD